MWHYGKLFLACAAIVVGAPTVFGDALDLTPKIKRYESFADIYLSWGACHCYEEKQQPLYTIEVLYKDVREIFDKTKKTEFAVKGQPYWKDLVIHLDCSCYGATQFNSKTQLNTGKGNLAPVEHLRVLNQTVLSWETNSYNVRNPDYYRVNISVDAGPVTTRNVTHKVTGSSTRQSTEIAALTSSKSIIAVSIEAVVIDVSSGEEYTSQPTKGILELLPHSGQVRNLTAEHIAYTTTAKVSWDQPEFTSDRHYGYLVSLTYPNQKTLHTVTENNTTTFTNIEALHKSSFNVNVLTLDMDHEGALIVGSEESTSFIFNSFDQPTLTRTQRYPDRIVYSVEMQSSDKDVQPTYFKVNGERFNGSTVVVSASKPYDECIVEAQTCVAEPEGLCGDKIVIQDLSNVAAPSSVVGLSALPTITTGDHFPSVTASWKKPVEVNGPINGYIIELRHGTDGPLVGTPITLDGHVTSYTFHKLPLDTVYEVRVRAFNVDLANQTLRHDGDTSQYAVLLPPFGDFTNVPTPYGVEAAAKPSSVAVSWQIPLRNRAKFFFVEAVPETSAGESNVDGYTESTWLDLRGLHGYTKYRGIVQACREQNRKTCGYPVQFSFKTLINAPSEPRNLTYVYTTETITVFWKPPADINAPSLHGYKVILQALPSQQKIGDTFPKPSYLTATFDKLEPMTTYRVTVVALNTDETGGLLSSVAASGVVTTDVTPSHISMIIFITMIVIGVICGTVFGLTSLRRTKNHHTTLIEQAEEL